MNVAGFVGSVAICPPASKNRTRPATFHQFAASTRDPVPLGNSEVGVVLALTVTPPGAMNRSLLVPPGPAAGVTSAAPPPRLVTVVPVANLMTEANTEGDPLCSSTV